jgi:hypothetical protein
MSLLYDKGERSANNFRKSRIHKFADFNNLPDLRIFRKCDFLQICYLRNTIFLWFAGLKLPQVRTNILFLFANISDNALIQFNPPRPLFENILRINVDLPVSTVLYTI